jgi:uncharacterized protein involved in exopolysaccharide biosynthesis
MNVRPQFHPASPFATGNREAHTPLPHAEQKLLAVLRAIGRWQGNPDYRIRRYAFVMVPPLLLIWLVVAAYCVFWPATYRSEMVLNLPGAGTNSSVNLSDIGQTSTSANTPFGDRSLSPKVIYQEIARSSRVRGMAAKHLGIRYADFPAPRIKLVDQTALMTIIMEAGSPEQAQRFNEVLLTELSAQLDVLRRDEIDRRASSINLSLKTVKANLEKARRKLLEFQANTAIVSIEQYQAMTMNLEQLRQTLTTRQAELQQTNQETERLKQLLKLSANLAAVVLELQADPAIAGLLTRRAEALREYDGNLNRWGPNHPKMVSMRNQVKASEQALRVYAAKLLPDHAEKVVDVLAVAGLGSKQTELLHSLVQLDVRRAGLEHAIASLSQSMDDLKKQVENSSPAAARLADLERDHKIAETVFSSALARVDTERQDIYASYPLLQVLAPASLPVAPAGPRRLFAVAGGTIASLFILFAVVLLWYRQTFVRKLLKSI